MKKKKVLEYGALSGGIIGGFLAYEYFKKRSSLTSPITSSSPTTTTSTSSVSSSSSPTTTSSTSSSSPTTTSTSSSSSSTSCSVIYNTNYSVQVLEQCFGVQVASCGYPVEFLSQNGSFCEAGISGLNYMSTMPNVTGTVIFNNQTDAFFGYWWVTGEWAVIPQCSCSGSKLVYNGGNGAFYFYGMILPNGYSWLPYYNAFTYGYGFLTYKGIYWGSPGLTGSAYQYLHQNNQNYVVNLTATPDELGYQPIYYNVTQSGSICIYDPTFKQSFCYSLESGQTFPFWATEGTNAYFCPPGVTSINQCQVIYGQLP